MLDARLVAEVRAMAAERGISLNQFVDEHLLRVIRNRRSFRSARSRALQDLRVGLDQR